jgi:HK97 family phage major capsid protein
MRETRLTVSEKENQMSLTNAAILELHQLQTEADQILSSSTVTRADQKRADLIISKMSSIRSTGVSGDELRRTLATEMGNKLGLPTPRYRTDAGRTSEMRAYAKWLHGASEESITRELRASTFVTGASAIGYSIGDNLGFVVPMQYNRSIVEGMKLYDPLFDEEIVTVVQEDNFSLRPLQIPGWDLSSVAAVKIGETEQESAGTIPTLNQPLLNKFTYRTAFDMSREFEEDAVTGYGADPIAALSRAQGIAIARGVGADLVNGDGTTGPQGIVTGSVDSNYVTAATGSLTHDDFSAVFFSVNKVHRDSPKAAWLVSDAVLKQIVNSKDGNQRPLFHTAGDVITILGKPVHVCPSLPNYNASLGTQAPGSFCVFGNLEHYVVHASAVLQRRFTQSPGLIEYGKVRFHSLVMVDAVVNNPETSGVGPIVSARLKA